MIRKLPIILIAVFACKAYAEQHILIVGTNECFFNGSQSGSFLLETAGPFEKFRKAGFQVDVLTPKGGKACYYGVDELDDATKIVAKSAEFEGEFSNSLSPAQITTKKYSAIYFPGGHSQFVDTVLSEDVATSVSAIAELGAVVGSAGHGTANLLKIKRSGRPIVRGVTMTAFPWWAEQKWMSGSNYGKLLPFDMEHQLLLSGAVLKKVTETSYKEKETRRIIDKKNKIITGAFATDADWVADEMVKVITSRN